MFAVRRWDDHVVIRGKPCGRVERVAWRGPRQSGPSALCRTLVRVVRCEGVSRSSPEHCTMDSRCGERASPQLAAVDLGSTERPGTRSGVSVSARRASLAARTWRGATPFDPQWRIRGARVQTTSFGVTSSPGWSAKRRIGDRTTEGGTMQQPGGRDRRAAPDDAARERTARRLMVARLGVQIARHEAERTSEPQLRQARRELRALTGLTRDTDRAANAAPAAVGGAASRTKPDAFLTKGRAAPC